MSEPSAPAQRPAAAATAEPDDEPARRECPLGDGSTERELVHRELAEEHGARALEPPRDERVARRDVIGQHARAAGHLHARDGDQIFQRDRHAVQRSATRAAADLGVGLFRLGERHVAGDRDVRAQDRVVRGDAIEVRHGRLDRGQLASCQRLADAAQVEIRDAHRHGSSSAAGTAARRRSRSGSHSSHIA